MAASTTISFSRLLPKPPPPASRSHHLPIRIPSPPPLSLSHRRFPRLISAAVQDNGGASETLNEEQQDEEETKGKGKEEGARVAEELKAMMAARKKAEEESNRGGGGDLIGGVVEEIREIEWPPFGKVVGTTGVVLAVIAGSSVALLTVNAVLAELSDRVFAGKGIQDFFG